VACFILAPLETHTRTNCDFPRRHGMKVVLGIVNLAFRRVLAFGHSWVTITWLRSRRDLWFYGSETFTR